ncbi:AA permease and/or GLTP domain containing protein [Asbolus verrucosus]|uniref:Solute carrier family 12 member 9 n=1 Tax=Asbolus verrucosus TaxID=1661398 RepID=A0A482VT81_ASBVE|nr:AA permease and/or GLTP domain containing protein [Asbolus verrucosus]
MLAPEEGSTNNPDAVDKTPLVGQTQSLFRKITGLLGRNQTQSPSDSGPSYVEFGSFAEQSETRTLGTFAGVFSPVTLSMFSALIFLRMVMISRTLGPEFGGSIGTLFFLANIVSSALCISGCVEGLVENFGPSGYLVKGLIPDGHWWQFLYCVSLNTLNLLVCLIGAAMFAKTTVFILAIVCGCLGITFFSYLYQGHLEVPVPDSNTLIQNSTNHAFGNYTGLHAHTLISNLWPEYGKDYTADGKLVTFASVFGVLFSGVTGIMAGANMSGELKNPGKSIPRGTLSAVVFTLVVYIAISLFTAFTCTADLLQNNYLFMAGVSVFPPSVTVGLLTATWSAALSNVIGGSRVLEALAKDNVFGPALAFIPKGTWNGNPVAAVLVSWVLVQLVLFIGSLNLIAQLNSVLFLLSYLATNLACLGLELASAPNFRPSFKYFTWHTAIIGLLGTLIMMFVISPIYAACSILLCLLLVMFLHLFSPSKEAHWGSISQALIFHQVRKYLLLLDSRKDHVKFWRPQVLLLVNSPRSACPLIDFINDLKKGGLYVLGHVVKGDPNGLGPDPTLDMQLHWLNLVDHLKVKAFIELTVAPSVRDGLRHLIRLSGMGAMKPNTVVLGFMDDEQRHDFLQSSDSSYQNNDFGNDIFPLNSQNVLGPLEYVQMMGDVLKMNKNLCLCRNFSKLKKDTKRNWSKRYIDVWPINFLNPGENDAFDTTSLFMMQLACIVNMVPLWSRLKLRLCICDEARQTCFSLNPNGQNHIEKLQFLLKKLRISATLFPVPGWNNVIESHGAHMETYLKRFFTLMGTVFGFVSKDLKSKMDILAEFLSDEKTSEHFQTVKKMIEYERDNELLQKKGYTSGSRTLLRLHRGLDFIRAFLKSLGDLKDEENTAAACREAYDATLAKYHPFVIKNGARIAMYTLPNREQLLKKVCGEQEEVKAALDILPKTLEATAIVYERIEALYTLHDLHTLP